MTLSRNYHADRSGRARHHVAQRSARLGAIHLGRWSRAAHDDAERGLDAAKNDAGWLAAASNALLGAKAGATHAASHVHRVQAYVDDANLEHDLSHRLQS